mgnify:CR=1 FL=1
MQESLGITDFINFIHEHFLTIGFTIVFAIYLGYKLFRAMFDNEDE